MLPISGIVYTVADFRNIGVISESRQSFLHIPSRHSFLPSQNHLCACAKKIRIADNAKGSVGSLLLFVLIFDKHFNQNSIQTRDFAIIQVTMRDQIKNRLVVICVCCLVVMVYVFYDADWHRGAIDFCKFQCHTFLTSLYQRNGLSLKSNQSIRYFFRYFSGKYSH